LLIAFHIGQIAVFGWYFHANMVLITLCFLPVDRWTPWIVARFRRDPQASARPGPAPDSRPVQAPRSPSARG
jgi:hypothetical protein